MLDSFLRVEIYLKNMVDCSKFRRYEKPSKTGKKLYNNHFFHGLLAKKGYVRKFISYNVFEEEETKIPKGFKAYKVSKEHMNKYFCGDKKLLLPSNKKYENIKKEHGKGYKSYYTRHNFGNPYLTYVNKTHVRVFKIPHVYFEKEYAYKTLKWKYIKKVLDVDCERVFIGKSIKNDLTKFSLSFGKEFDGNTILLKMSKNRYIFIGYMIMEFKTDDEIQSYISPIGNNDVSYPVAFGKKYIYLLVENVAIDRSDVKDLTKDQLTDIYTYYYGYERKDLNLMDKAIKLKFKRIDEA